MTDHALIAPHMVASLLWQHARSVFFSRFIGSSIFDAVSAQDRLAAWWRKIPDFDPRLSPLIEAYTAAGIVSGPEDFMRRAIPYALHGDAVPCTKRMSLDTVSWSACVPQGLSTMDAKFLMCGILNRCRGVGTLAVMWSIISWALGAFSSGLHPMTDFENKAWIAGSDAASSAGLPFSGPFFFVCWMIRGDLEYFSNYLNVNHFNSLFPCPWCDCN